MSNKASKAHSDLNTFAMMVTLLEGGHIFLTESYAAKEAIIKICKKQQGVCLRIHDQALSRIEGEKS